MTDTTPEPGAVPHVYTAIGAILSSLSVEKNGTLPSNMGGKGYVTASDVSLEVKRQFVENNLVLIPNEEYLKHEILPFKDRLNIAIVISGHYTIISTQDGSSVTVSGTGDGLATGTAVASNIASTNALKNALLRTFLITEQSVEDAAKTGPAEEAAASRTSTPAQQKVAAARERRPAAPANLKDLNDRIRAAIDSGKVKKDDVNATIAVEKEAGKNPVEQRLAAIAKYSID